MTQSLPSKLVGWLSFSENENETDWLVNYYYMDKRAFRKPGRSYPSHFLLSKGAYVDLQTNTISHLHPELPHATHGHPGNGTKVVGGYDGALLGATHTRHTLQEKTRDNS